VFHGLKHEWPVLRSAVLRDGSELIHDVSVCDRCCIRPHYPIDPMPATTV